MVWTQLLHCCNLPICLKLRYSPNLSRNMDIRPFVGNQKKKKQESQLVCKSLSRMKRKEVDVYFQREPPCSRKIARYARRARARMFLFTDEWPDGWVSSVIERAMLGLRQPGGAFDLSECAPRRIARSGYLPDIGGTRASIAGSIGLLHFMARSHRCQGRALRAQRHPTNVEVRYALLSRTCFFSEDNWSF